MKGISLQSIEDSSKKSREVRENNEDTLDTFYLYTFLQILFWYNNISTYSTKS